MILAIEGVDASGKQTQCRRLRERIAATYTHFKVQVHDFPHGSSVSGPHIKSMLRELWGVGNANEVRALVLQSLQTINKYESINMLQNAKHWPDEVLILDRYYGSALAYGEADGLPKDFLMTIHRGLPVADLTILIDLSVEESVRRRPVREDQYESDMVFLGKVRHNYLNIFADETRPLGRVKIIDGSQSEDIVHEVLFQAFEQHIRWDHII